LDRYEIFDAYAISNNRAERSIKPFVIGRKNWLFCNTPKGARTSSVIYSVIETAKENGLNPYEYLKHLFTVMPNMPKERTKNCCRGASHCRTFAAGKPPQAAEPENLKPQNSHRANSTCQITINGRRVSYLSRRW